MGRVLPPYTKPHLSFSDQLALLMQRGLITTDQARALKHLQRIGYGRLAPYWEPFQRIGPHPLVSGRTVRLQQFKPDAEFGHAVDLYLFDKRLRLLFMDAVERIEVALRVDLAYALGKRDPWAHLRPSFLDPHRAAAPLSAGTRHQAWLDKANLALSRSREPWIGEFQASYSSPLPIWMAVEAWDFGTLSWLLEMAHPNDRTAIATRYGLRPNTLVSWTKTLNFIRNIAAHHARLWNRSIINQPHVPTSSEAPAAAHIGTNTVRRTRVYGATVVAAHLLQHISPGSSWVRRMRDHWLAFPAMPYAEVAYAGFLPSWSAESIWN